MGGSRDEEESRVGKGKGSKGCFRKVNPFNPSPPSASPASCTTFEPSVCPAPLLLPSPHPPLFLASRSCCNVAFNSRNCKKKGLMVHTKKKNKQNNFQLGCRTERGARTEDRKNHTTPKTTTRSWSIGSPAHTHTHPHTPIKVWNSCTAWLMYRN